MARRKRGTYPYDYTPGDELRFADSGDGGTLRVLHGPGRGMGVTDGVVCAAEVTTSAGTFLGASEAGKLGKEHRVHGTVPGDRITVAVTTRFAGDSECDCGSGGCTPVLEELTGTCDVVLTGDLDDVVRFGLGPAWQQVVAIDTGEPGWESAPTACRWGAGVRIRGARPADEAVGDR